MKIIEITPERYAEIYQGNKASLVLHSCWTESERGAAMTAWSLTGRDNWLIQVITEEGNNHTHYLRESELDK